LRGFAVSIALPELPLTADVPVPIELKRFTVEQYHLMIEKGLLADDESLELLEGLLVHKMGKKRRHSLATHRLRKFLEPLLAGFYLDTQEPVTTNDSEPEPDASVVRGQREDYPDRQPLAADTPLVIEMADVTVYRDRVWKKRIYARAGIAIYWIVNLVDEQVEVYSQPSGPCDEPDYGSCQIIASDGTLPVVIDGKEVGKVKVKDLLP
jgi:Uma2 family endonuclease